MTTRDILGTPQILPVLPRTSGVHTSATGSPETSNRLFVLFESHREKLTILNEGNSIGSAESDETPGSITLIEV